MAEISVNGVIKHIGATEKVNDTISKRLLVVVDNSNAQYPKDVPITFLNKKCEVLDKFIEGQTVSVGVNLSGRQGKNGTWYPSIDGWKIN